MSDANQPKSPATEQKIIDATHIVDKFELRTGVSPKSGNPYTIGVLKIKTARGRSYALDLKYLDDNAQDVIEDALEFSNESDRQEFQKDIRN